MLHKLAHYLNKYAYYATLPEDTDEERLRKAILVILVSMTTICGIFWGALYAAIGVPESGAIPLIYSLICSLSLAHFMVVKHYRFFGYSQLVMILLLPVFLQWSLGGFAASSVVILFSFISCIAALIFFGARYGRLWFGFFVVFVLFSGAIDSELSLNPAQLPGDWDIFFFVMNVLGTLTISYIILLYFVMEREQAQELSERLLLNVLPYPIARRLKHEDQMIADEFEEVTILFADIVNFTPLSEEVGPTELVNLLGQIFTTIDTIADKHGLEKIKTIGDAYMAVGGLPHPRADHAEAVAEMALDMLEILPTIDCWRENNLSFRIGINTGPVVAGVIGKKKFIYDLWGDAVNTASRMESHGQAGAIQVTRHTYDILKDRYCFEYRGTISVKGKGEMETYLLTGRQNHR